MKFNRLKTTLISLATLALLSMGAGVIAETRTDLNIELAFNQVELPDFWKLAESRMSLPPMPGTAIGYQTQSVRRGQPTQRRIQVQQVQTPVQG